MDIPASPSLFARLSQLQTQAEVEAECIDLIKEHYRNNPGVVLEECLYRGFRENRPYMIAASISLAPRVSGIQGCEHLPRDLKEKWVDQITLRGERSMLSSYVDLCLGGKPSALWETGIGGYKSHLRMWFNQSPFETLPLAMEFIHTHPSGERPPSAEIIGILNSMIGYPPPKVAKLVEHLFLEDHEPALRKWLSTKEGTGNAACSLVVATRFPDHEIWQSPEFWLVCSCNLYPPAFEHLAMVLPEKNLEQFNEMMSRSTSSKLWENAVGRRIAAGQAAELEGQAHLSQSVRRTARL